MAAHTLNTVIINGQTADCSSENLIFLNGEIDVDANKPSVSGTYNIKSIVIPATTTNIAIFDGVVGALPIVVYSDGNIVFVGKCYISQRGIKGNGHSVIYDGISLDLLAESNVWSERLKNKRVRDLWIDRKMEYRDAFGTLQEMAFNNTNVQYTSVGVSDGFFNLSIGGANSTFRFVWRYFKNTTPACTNDTHYPPYSNIPENQVFPIMWFELSPHINIADVVKEMFRSVGYTMQSRFWNDTELANRLYMPLPHVSMRPIDLDKRYSRVGQDNAIVIPTGTSVTATYNFDKVLKQGARNNFDLTTDHYTISDAGIYQIAFKCKRSVGVFTARLKRTVNGVTTTLATSSAFGTQLISLFHEDTVTPVNTSFYFIEYEGTAISMPLTVTDGEFEVTLKESNPYFGYKYNMHEQIRPDLNCMDMLLGLSGLFNLVFDADEANKVIYIEPQDNWIETYHDGAGADVVANWDGFYSAIKDANSEVDIAKTANERFEKVDNLQTLTYKSDNLDPTVKTLEQQTGGTLFGVSYQLTNGAHTGAENVTENKFFAPTLMQEVLQLTVGQPTFVPIAWSKDLTDNEPTSIVQDTEPRLLLLRDTLNNEHYVDGEDDGANPNQGAPFIIVSPLLPFEPYMNEKGFCLSYSNEQGKTGLLQRFHGKRLERMNKGRTLDIELRIDRAEYNDRIFQTKRYIYNNLYIPNYYRDWNPMKVTGVKWRFTEDAVFDATAATNIINSTTQTVLTNGN
jgi:hypothetical protein